MVGPRLSRPVLGMTVLSVICLVVLSCSSVVQAAATSSGCPADWSTDWTAHGQSCYTVVNLNRRLTLQKAHMQCYYRRSKLAEIASKEVHQLLTRMIHSTNTWIGLTDVSPSRGGPLFRGPYWMYSMRSLVGSPYQPPIKSDFYQSWAGSSCFYMGGNGSIETSLCNYRREAAICQKPRQLNVDQDCPRCNITKHSQDEQLLVQKARCNDFAIIGKIQKEVHSHFYFDVLAICANSSAAHDALSHMYHLRTPSANSQCIPVARTLNKKPLPVLKPLASPLTARCPQPCGLGLKRDKRYLVAGTVNPETKEFSVFPGGALRWHRVKRYFKSPAACEQ
ncbi:uncharacterized protein LOC135820927 [Sycon ciliatum]|uniref:uncharacterized protein LOC135820927 n=1 Tax=Sycon ciliatum TaxID=27933 RepID=UPI0031F6FF82